VDLSGPFQDLPEPFRTFSGPFQDLSGLFLDLLGAFDLKLAKGEKVDLFRYISFQNFREIHSDPRFYRDHIYAKIGQVLIS
jgi:hypothetical protein